MPAAECGSPLLRGDQTNPFLHDVKDAGGSRRIRNSVTGHKTSARPIPIRSMTEWWSQTGSNRRPPACKAGALPTELWPQQHAADRIRSNAGLPEPIAKASPAEARAAVNPPGLFRMVGLGRLELPTSRLSGVRSNHLSYRPEGSRTHVRPERKRNEDGGVPPVGADLSPDCSNDAPIGPEHPETLKAHP